MADENEKTGGQSATPDNKQDTLGAETAQTTPAADSAQTPAGQGANQQDEDIRDPAAYYKAQAEKYQRLHEKTESRVQELESKVQSFDAQARAEVEKMLADMKAEIDAAKAEAETERLNAFRVKAAAKHGLPADLATRLSGDDEAAIMADAESLAKLLPATGKRPSAGNPAGESTLTMDEVKKLTTDEYIKRRDEVHRFLNSQKK